MSLHMQMRVELPDGLLSGARQCPSPYQDARPDGCVISLVVVHGISLPAREFGGPWIERLFCGTLDCAAHAGFAALAGLRVSAHFLIRRDGELIQYVPCAQRAWHAGVSLFEGRECCNDFSIGIELEGADEVAYEDIQYQRLAAVLRALMLAYPDITPARIVGHSDIAPGRKTDPGPAFDWPRLRALLRA
jgi:AmpD protein